MIEDYIISPSRNTDPITSHIAAKSNIDIRGEQRRQVYEFLVSQDDIGATDYEISIACGILRTSAGKRRKELEEQGHVIATNYRRKTDTNSTAIVWRVV